MIREITDNEWNSLIINFQESQYIGHTLSECLADFVYEYGKLLEKAKNEEEIEEDFEQDTYTKINNLWNYIYKLEDNLRVLQLEFNNHKMHSVLSLYQPKPYYVPDPTMSEWKVTSNTDSTTKQTNPFYTVNISTQEVDPRYKQEVNGETWTGKY